MPALPPLPGCAVSTNSFLISAGRSLGLTCSRSAAVPATIAQAHDVPFVRLVGGGSSLDRHRGDRHVRQCGMLRARPTGNNGDSKRSWECIELPRAEHVDLLLPIHLLV